MRALLAGHWSGPGGIEGLSATTALADVARGFGSRSPEWEVDTVPFGPGRALAEAVGGAPGRALGPVVVGIEEASTARAGREVLRVLAEGFTPVVEGGHNIDVDAGLGFLEVLSGVPLGRGARPGTPVPLDEGVPLALRRARAELAGRDLLAAASTSRPLLGLASVLAIGVDLEARTVQDRALTATLARALAGSAGARRSLPVLGADLRVTTPDHSRLPGSGAAGGAAAMVAAIGGRIVATGDLLADVTDLRARMADVDLVVVLEPLLHSPHLADSVMDPLTSVAAGFALPVVAVGRESSLSSHEAAEWGLHGVITAGPGRGGLVDAGRRVARTWARAPR